MSPQDPGRLLRTARQFRAELLRNERRAASEMVRAYGASWVQIRGYVDDLLKQRDDALARGEEVGPGWLKRMQRLEQLEEQIRQEFRNFAEFADPIVTRQQQEAIDAAREHAEQLTRVALGEAPDGISVRWNQVPREALIDLVGFSSSGSPLGELFAALGEGAGVAARDVLITGFALGENPRKIARRMTKAMGMQLDRALRISRTEVLRSYREATRRDYAENADIMNGWIWHSACDLRTCAMCWAMHGTKHSLEETLDDHVCGRCAMLPDTKSWEELGFPGIESAQRPIPTGEEEFAKLDPAKQRMILGGAAFEAYKAGAVTLGDFVGRRYDADWGSMRYAKSLLSILGADEATKYRQVAYRELHPPTEERVVEPVVVQEELASIKQSFNTLFLTEKQRARFESATDAIDSVHQIPADAPKLPIEYAAIKEEGLYIYNSSDGTPAGIQIKLGNRTPEEIMAHEMGHYIDHQLLARTIKDRQPDSWASESSSFLDGWRTAIDGTKTVQRLREMLKTGKVALEEDQSVLVDADAGFTKYLLQRPELFARSYSQYIALRSGNKRMGLAVNEALYDQIYGGQWSSEEFEPIARAFDILFEKLGWAR